MEIDITTGSNDFTTIYSRDSPQARVFKIIVIGDSNVGKTCLTYQFCSGKFLKNPEATIRVDFRERTLQLDGENIKLQMCDSMLEHYNVHAMIFVYDVTNLACMVPCILIGNKCCLKEMRAVSTFLAQQLADIYNFAFFETSARDPAEKEHFLTLTYKLKNHKPLRLKQPSDRNFDGEQENTIYTDDL